jgi:hypothetical protein
MKMKKVVSAVFLALMLLALPANAVHAAESDILREIKSLREDMTREIKTLREDTTREFITLREDMNKRFEQVDKRFEQVDKRFDQLLWFIGLWIPLSMAVVGYILQRINKHDDRFFELFKKVPPVTKKRLKEALKG